MDDIPSLVVFGALGPWPGHDWQMRLQTTLKETQTLKPIADALRELPLLWDSLTCSDTALHASSGKAAATNLAHWITREIGEHLSLEEERNALMMPMAVISHVIQYLEYLKLREGGAAHSAVLESVTNGGGVQGFCAGLLSALAVASAKSEEDIGVYAASSVRLAFCIGAYIDFDQASSFGFTKLAVRWPATTSRETIEDLLATYQEVRK